MRRTAFLGFLVFLCSIAATAGTITSLSPSAINVASGEYFLTINGVDLGDTVTYSGPAGTFSVLINASNASSVTAWVPMDVANRAGAYSVTVTGRNGSSGPATFSVNDPRFRFVLLVPDVLLASAITREGAYVKFELATWSPDKDQGDVRIDCDPPAGSLFKLGTTRVSCTATNAFGEKADGSFNVTVVDDTAPDVKVPDDIVTEATDENGAIVKFDASAFDAIDGELRVSCNRASGSLFAVGKTTVTCTATDLSLNPGSRSFLVDVRGKSHMTLHVPEGLVVEADSAEGSRVPFEVTADGTEDPEPKIKCDPQSGSLFPIGTSTVTCHGEDRFGASADARFELTVADTMGPVLSTLISDPQYLVPVDGSMVSVAIKAEAIDLVDPSPRCSVTGVNANEPISLDDWKIVSESEVLLRAARSGKTDRIYGVTVTCTDANRNESAGTASVVVPASGEAPKPGASSAVTGRRRAGGK